MTLLLTFLIAFSHRVLSGWQSMFLYLNYRGNASIYVALVSIITLSSVFVIGEYTTFAIIFAFAYSICLSLKIMSFYMAYSERGSKFWDIHLWENAVTGSFWLYLFLTGHDIIALCCSVYPSLIIHKGLINKGNGLKFFDERTDDATGKTYAIPFLKLKIRRTPNWVRYALAAISISVLILAYRMEWHLSLSLL